MNVNAMGMLNILFILVFSLLSWKIPVKNKQEETWMNGFGEKHPFDAKFNGDFYKSCNEVWSVPAWN